MHALNKDPFCVLLFGITFNLAFRLIFFFFYVFTFRGYTVKFHWADNAKAVTKERTW